MARIDFEVATQVPAQRFIAALTDFSPARAEVWPNIDAEHLTVHEVGDDWAEVTEGSSFAGGVWERNRYDWSQPGTVRVQTLESNTWRPGSSWRYRVEPAGTGSRIQVTVDRRPLTPKGRLVAALLVVLGRRVLRRDLERVLATLDR
jgi:Polyketide cyclase / dehydrase and lipid transport